MEAVIDTIPDTLPTGVREAVERYLTTLYDRFPDIGQVIGVIELEGYYVVRVALRRDDDLDRLAEGMADVSTKILLETGHYVIGSGV
jgi:hypothetical protein